MHPIEHLRFVARADDVAPGLLVQEAARALSSFTWDRPGLVMACRRLVSRQAGSAAMVWLVANTMAAVDPRRALDEAVEAFGRDATPDELAQALPQEAVVTVLGGLDESTAALERRGDVVVRVVESGTTWGADDVVRRLRSAGTEASTVPAHGLGAAAATADVVVLEAHGVGPEAFLAAAGSRALAATAAHAGVPVWLCAGVGRVLPAAMWEPFAARAVPARGAPDLEAALELVPLDLVDAVVGPDGLVDVATGAARHECPVLPELFRGDVI